MEPPFASRVQVLLLAVASCIPFIGPAGARRPLGPLIANMAARVAPSPRVAAHICHVLAIVAYYLLPSFVRSCIFPSSAAAAAAIDAKKPLSPTAYLDGLRGVAALIVCIYHWIYFAFPRVKAGYPTLEAEMHPEERCLWARLPFIRTLQSGRGSVAVFFVISGIVLSLRAVTLARQRRFAQALESLAQSAFRRPFRIYPPIFAITFFVAVVLLRFEGLYVKHKYNFSIPPRENSTMVQIEGWAYNMTALVDHSRFLPSGIHMYKPPYDGYLWTIPAEMKGSVYVFVLLLAFLRVRPVVRVGVIGSLTMYLCRTGSMDMGLFLAGMILAEATVYLTADRSTKQQRRSMTDVISQAGVYCMAITGFWMLGYPDEKDKHAYGFACLSKITPEAYAANEFVRQFFWLSFGAILFVAALVLCPMTGVVEPTKNEYDLLPSASPVDSLPPSPTRSVHAAAPPEPLLRRPFVTPFAQYLGRISFALYLCQSAVIKTISAQYTTVARETFQLAEATAKAALTGGVGMKVVVMADTAVTAVMRKGEYDALMADAWSAYLWVEAKNAVVSLVVLFWASDLFYLYVDRHAAGIGRMVARWCWVSDI